MEFLRFGSRISGTNIGCCAFDIIQGFDYDPDAKASIQIVNGDGGCPCTKDGKQLFAGPTYRDIFWQRLRSGTFDQRDMPNHGFLAIITTQQLEGKSAPKWLAILKEAGFEFIRAVDNSVYSYTTEVHTNYLFGLFRNVNDRGLDPFAPPKAWTKLPENTLTQKEVWDKIGPPKFLTEEEVRKAGAEVYLAGTKGDIPKRKVQEEKKETKTPWAKQNQEFVIAKLPE
jgi:hypothetical protein